jgi:hypothetical protein
VFRRLAPSIRKSCRRVRGSHRHAQGRRHRRRPPRRASAKGHRQPPPAFEGVRLPANVIPGKRGSRGQRDALRLFPRATRDPELSAAASACWKTHKHLHPRSHPARGFASSDGTQVPQGGNPEASFLGPPGGTCARRF